MKTEEVSKFMTYVQGIEADIKQLRADNRDMNAAVQTIFQRCRCGRIRERGIICPTNRQGGNCEAGR